MSGPIQLFSIQFKPSISRPHVALLCQSVKLEEEIFLWADGLNMNHPVLIPISAAKEIEFHGSFRDFMVNNLAKTQSVLAVSNGEHTPTILARAVQYMTRDPQLQADDALDMAVEQGLDILDQDGHDRVSMSTAMAAAAPA